MIESIWLATYDISDAWTLQRVSKLLERYMIRMQRSVFAGLLSDELVSEIYGAVMRLLGKNDEFAFIHMCKADVRKMVSLHRFQAFESLIGDCLVL